MNQNGIQTSFWTMVFIQTIGSVDMPGSGARKMPAPRQYVAIFITWMVLQLVSGISAGAERAAAALGWLLVLAGLVIGPFGQRVVTFFQNTAVDFQLTPNTGNTGPAGPVGPVGSPAATSPTTPRSVLA